MTQETRDLLERALKLPEEDRARLAEVLLGSLGNEADDDAGDPAVERAWAVELGRRVRRALETGERGRSADEILTELRAKHGLA
jgi:hypothetical protein